MKVQQPQHPGGNTAGHTRASAAGFNRGAAAPAWAGGSTPRQPLLCHGGQRSLAWACELLRAGEPFSF